MQGVQGNGGQVGQGESRQVSEGEGDTLPSLHFIVNLELPQSILSLFYLFVSMSRINPLQLWPSTQTCAETASIGRHFITDVEETARPCPSLRDC